MRLADRLRQVLGQQSPEWNALRQGAWMRVTRGSEDNPATVARQIREFTDGSGKSLAMRLFSPTDLGATRRHAEGLSLLEHVVGQLASEGAARYREAYDRLASGETIGGMQGGVFRRIVDGTATPEEVANATLNVVGNGNAGNTNRRLRAGERLAGRDSPAWAAVRQGVWTRLVANEQGRTQPGAQRISEQIARFLGDNRTTATLLYSPAEQATMRRYADALRLTIPPRDAVNSSNSGLFAADAAKRAAGSIMASLGFSAGGPVGAAAGAIAAGGYSGVMGALRSARALSAPREAMAGAGVPAAVLGAAPLIEGQVFNRTIRQ